MADTVRGRLWKCKIVFIPFHLDIWLFAFNSLTLMRVILEYILTSLKFASSLANLVNLPDIQYVDLVTLTFDLLTVQVYEMCTLWIQHCRQLWRWYDHPYGSSVVSDIVSEL